MRRLSLALLFAAVAFAADPTGKWSGAFDEIAPDGSVKHATAYMDLKVSGQTVTGTAGPAESRQSPISAGRLEGKKLTFELVRAQGTLKFDLTFDGESIQGGASAAQEDGSKLNARLDLKRLP